MVVGGVGSVIVVGGDGLLLLVKLETTNPFSFVTRRAFICLFVCWFVCHTLEEISSPPIKPK